ncbi:MAG: acyloxyacyl hydrolase [Ectothiorhodospiraceae bacterium]|nr:acyloxyacyl hydrolase [Ectothiorhodospiraceae bacterium]MCH8506079.1 acyloxyacyl hydrolase [Ectothiorhodospiraceae bacterium]
MPSSLRRFSVRLLPPIVLLSSLSGAAGAYEIGIRAGTNLGGSQSYSSQEIYVRAPLPGVLGDPGGWHATSYAEANAGRVASSGDSLTTVGAGVGAWLRSPAAPVSFGLGTGPTYLSRTSLGDHDYGGNWQFTSHAGVRLALGPHVTLGYRIQHTSNAGLYSPNNGYDLQALEIRLTF